MILPLVNFNPISSPRAYSFESICGAVVVVVPDDDSNVDDDGDGDDKILKL